LYGTQDSPFDTLIQWRRPEEVAVLEENEEVDPTLVVYNSKIEVNDIKEGSLGNGWFISALATLAEVPLLIERLFLTKTHNKEGVYRVKLCKNGEWSIITVDDYIPCIPDSGPIFAKTSPNELWVSILEKAYAKLHGSYLTLKGGFAHEALMDLTGCPCTYYDFEDSFIKEMIANGSLWNRLKEAEEKGFLLSASTFGEQRWADTPTGDTEDNSLLAGHSYTINGLSEYKGSKILKIRNIWGQFDW
jgi:calpain-15